jgi:hypothetical protein
VEFIGGFSKYTDCLEIKWFNALSKNSNYFLYQQNPFGKFFAMYVRTNTIRFNKGRKLILIIAALFSEVVI